MTRRAPRLRWRLWYGSARGAGLALSLWLTPVGGAAAQTITAAAYAEPTTRYAHGVLGDAVEWGALVLTLAPCAGCAARQVTLRLPETRVFEDLAPRLMTTETGDVLAMVVESDLRKGARLALYDTSGVVAATPFIGRPNRWLAPVGAADLDGDGAIEIAYVDRPHLAKTLRIWRVEEGALRPVASAEGFSNHRIGWDYILGGLRDCGEGPEIVLPSGDWTHVMVVDLTAGGGLDRYASDPYSPEMLTVVMDCR